MMIRQALLGRTKYVVALSIGAIALLPLACGDDDDTAPVPCTCDCGGNGGTAGSGGVYTAANVEEGVDAKFDYEIEEVPFRVVQGAEHTSLGIELAWADTAAHPLPYDFSVRMAGVSQPLFQLFAIDESPFGRAGQRVEPLDADTRYRLELTRSTTAVWARLISVEDGSTVLSGPVSEIAPESGDIVTLATAKDEPQVLIGKTTTWASAD